jgi:alpha-ketoglutarate-dependent taurine dioxygenase
MHPPGVGSIIRTTGDFLLFDNTGTLHQAAPYDHKSRRLMDRSTLCGEESIA